jgi:hypothetical protein
MAVNDPFVFQADSKIVNDFYQDHLNYIIQYDDSVPKEYCVVYFSSNDIYYPNNDIAFTESIINKNRFEWYGNRVNYGHKHIFLRDIKKQWYLTGINKDIDSPQKMFEFLKEETQGYKIILIGSSAGGFISVILGQLLNAERIYSFNGQFEILSILDKKSAPSVDPVLYRNKDNENLLPFYDASKFISCPETIYYFHSGKSNWDIEQYAYLNGLKINKITFKTSNHGIPFLKSNLPVVLNLPLSELKKISGKTFNPLTFSLKMVGLLKTLEGVKSIIQFGLNKVYIRSIQKWKRS